MKRLSLIVLLLSCTGMAAIAQSLAGANVPESVTQAFQTQFATQQAQWIVSDQEIEAQFKKDGVASFAYYSLQGQYIGLEQESSFESFPTNAREFVNKSFIEGSQYTLLSSRSREEEAPNQNLYVAFLQNSQQNMKIKLFFDAQGQLIRRQLYN
jgi:hypothetical protein